MYQTVYRHWNRIESDGLNICRNAERKMTLKPNYRKHQEETKNTKIRSKSDSDVHTNLCDFENLCHFLSFEF